jgi:hypothetical protein
VTVAKQPNDVGDRALTAALIADDRDKFFSEDDRLVTKPFAMPVCVIPVNAGDA